MSVDLLKKRCPRCKLWKGKPFFSRRSSNKDGLRNECRLCSAIESKQCRDKRPKEERREYSRQHRLDNLERITEYNRNYYVNNTEYFRLKEAQRREIKGKERNQYTNQWKRDNPDKVKASNDKRRANRTLAFVEDVRVSVLRKRDGGNCFYCQDLLDFSKRDWSIYNPRLAELEHKVPLARGGLHSYDNCVLSCSECNGKKHNMTADEFFERMAAEDAR